MAEAWGNEVYHGAHNRWQCICNAWVSSYPNATQAIITVQAILYTPWATSSNQYYGYTEVSGWGSGENQGGVNTPNSPTRTVIRQQSFTVNRPQGSDANFWCVARVRNTGSYTPGESAAGVNVPVAHIAYTTPRVPKDQKVTKNSDYQATVTWTGDYTGMDGTQPWAGVYIDRKTDSGSWVQLATVSWDKTSYVDKSITTGHSYRYGLRSYGPGGTSARVQTGTITTSYTPNAPTSCSASRVSDSQAKVTWKNNPATNRPYVNVLLERQTDSGSWTQIASLGSATANYTDNGLSANHRYAYRVRAKNNAGYSGYATSGYIYTTPKAPSSVSVTKVSNTQVSVNISGAAAWATSYNVQYSLNGGSWTSAGSTTAWPYKHTPGGGTVKYRVQAVRGSLTSGWVESGTVQTIMPPNAPSISLSPSASVVPVGTDVKVSWKPNHPDGSAQSSAQVEVTVGSAAAVVHDVSGSTRTYAIGSQSSATTVKVRVRTKGLDPDWGAWSSYATISIAVVPTGYFSYPPTDNAPVGGVPVDLSWSITDPAGVASQTLSLIGPNGTTVYQTDLSGSVRELSIGPDIYTFANLATYTASITVYSGSGLTATVARSFRTSWAGPADPFPRVTYGDGLSASVTVGDSESVPSLIGQVDRPAGSLLPGVTVYGNTRQNLWANPSGTVNGVTVTANANGSIAVEGTATQRTIIKYESYALRANSSYTVSSDKKIADTWIAGQAESGAGFAVIYRDSSDVSQGQALFGYGDVLTKSFAVSSTAAYVEFCVIVEEGTTVDGTYRVMLNEGSEAEPWCPPGLNRVDELSVVTAGKNLCAIDHLEGMVWADANPELTADTISNLNALAGVPLTVTWRATLTSADESSKVPSSQGGVIIALASGTQLTGRQLWGSGATVGTQKTIVYNVEIPEGDPVANFYVYGCGSSKDSSQRTNGEVDLYLQIEVGDDSTAWEPYAATTTPVDLDSHVLNSLPDGTRDELTIDATGAVTLVQRVGVATAPTEARSWQYAADVARASFTLPSAGPTSEDDETEWLLCDKLPARKTFDDASYALVSALQGFAKNPAIISTATAATVVGGATYLYPLATPKPVELGSVVMPELPSDRSFVFASAPIPADVMVTYPETESFSVTRIAPDGSQWLVASGLTDGQQALDPLPPLNTDYSYTVTGYTVTGEATSKSIGARIDALVTALNFGQGASVFRTLELNPSRSRSIEVETELYSFADGGESDGLPVAYSTTALDVTGREAATVLTVEEYRDLEAIARRYPMAWVRDVHGGRSYCHCSWSFSAQPPLNRVDCDISVTETRFREAW